MTTPKADNRSMITPALRNKRSGISNAKMRNPPNVMDFDTNYFVGISDVLTRAGTTGNESGKGI